MALPNLSTAHPPPNAVVWTGRALSSTLPVVQYGASLLSLSVWCKDAIATLRIGLSRSRTLGAWITGTLPLFPLRGFVDL
jgi:hypothetical protein